MSNSLTPAQFIHEWFQKVWNERDESTIDRLLNPQGDVQGLNLRDATSLRGPEDFKAFQRAFLSAIPDLHFTVNKVIEQGDWLAVHFTCEGTHTGEGIGVPPSREPVCFLGMAMGRIEKGQWVEGWNSVDFLSLNQQVGGPMRVG